MTTVFTAAPHHDVLVLIIQIALLLLVARALGEIAQRLGQPSVVGEILAGIVLGPSLLSGLVPQLGTWIVPQTATQGHLLEVVSLIGVMFLLLLTGLETDLALIKRQARAAIGASLGGITVTFSTGFLLGWMLPDALLANQQQRLVFSLFVATAMAITAIPVIAKVLMDMNLMRRDVGQTILAAGMTDDTIGWTLLSIVAGLAAGDAVTAGTFLGAIGSVLAFMVLSFTIGRWLVKWSLDFVQDEVRSRDRLLTLVVVLTFAWGAVSHALNLEAVLGAFFMGILFGRMPRLPAEVVRKVESVTLGIFAPIFFAVAGLKVDIAPLFTRDLFFITLLVIFVASFGKICGVYLGARFIGKRDHWTALAMGAGMNARGAMEIIVATIGLQIGVLTQEMFSIIGGMAMTTSLLAPPALRWALKRVTPESQELARLKREELTAASEVAAIRRILVPMRMRASRDDTNSLDAHVISRLAGHDSLSVTLLNVSPAGNKAEGQEFLEGIGDQYGDVELTRKVVEAGNAQAAILAEAEKDYHLLILGATERSQATEALFHPMVDDLVRLAPCPTIVARGGKAESNWPPRRLLVPTNGTAAAHHAAEFAFRLATQPDEEVVVLSVSQGAAGPGLAGTRIDLARREHDARRQMVDQLVALGSDQGVNVRGEVAVGPDVEDSVLEYTRRGNVDLIVLGTDVRPGSGRLYLGQRVERLLEEAPCPVLVVNWNSSAGRSQGARNGNGSGSGKSA